MASRRLEASSGSEPKFLALRSCRTLDILCQKKGGETNDATIFREPTSRRLSVVRVFLAKKEIPHVQHLMLIDGARLQDLPCAVEQLRAQLNRPMRLATCLSRVPRSAYTRQWCLGLTVCSGLSYGLAVPARRRGRVSVLVCIQVYVHGRLGAWVCASCLSAGVRGMRIRELRECVGCLTCVRQCYCTRRQHIIAPA